METSDKILYGIFAFLVGMVVCMGTYLTYVETNSEYINKPNQILEVLNKENRIISVKPMVNYAKYITLKNDIEIKVDVNTYNNIQIGDTVEISITEQVYNGEVIETTYEIIGVIE